MTEYFEILFLKWYTSESLYFGILVFYIEFNESGSAFISFNCICLQEYKKKKKPFPKCISFNSCHRKKEMDKLKVETKCMCHGLLDFNANKISFRCSSI